MKLSKRLQAIADLIIKYKHGESLGDIGTDHAYLPCYLVNENVIQRAYACDIAKGPIQASIETIGSYHLENKVIPLLGSGIHPLLDQHVDMISICGMGGKLIVDILDEFPEYIQDQRLFLQANVGLEVLREYLYLHQIEIIDEDIVKDAQTVLKNLVPIDREVAAMNGRYYTLRIAPYRTMENSIRGLVITIIDSLGTSISRKGE